MTSLKSSTQTSRSIRPSNRRFWAKVRRTNGCWLWLASKDSKGYGTFRIAGETVSAHRLAWFWKNGSIPNGQSVLHSCDNRACVRPSHLFLGTHQDNMEDMKNKGRSATCGFATVNNKGARNAYAKLTEAEVDTIRAAYAGGALQADLAARYNISQSNVSLIVNRVNWRHI